jgi:hypothetical protein
LHERKFQKALGGLINMEIGLFLSDNQFIEGVLLDVKQDHIVVDVNQNIFYYALQHIKALSKNAKNYHISSEIVHFVDENYLVDVLNALRYNWVSINSLSDQVLFGVLSKISDDHVTVINNSEILYIPKSNICNITSDIPEEQIILMNTQQQLEIPACQIDKQITSEYTQKTIEFERITTIEVPILEISASERTKDENVINEQPEVHPKTKMEIDATILKSPKHNLLNKDVDNKQSDDIIQKTDIQGFISHIGNESNGQIDASVIEMQACQLEKQVIVEQSQTINETKPIKSLESPILKELIGEGVEIDNVPKENSEISSQTILCEVPNLSGVVNQDLVKRVNECLPEEDHPGVLESSSKVSGEEQLFFTESKVKRKKKRVLLTEWSTMNNDQHALASHNNFDEGNELSDYEENSIKTEQPSDRINSLIQPFHDPYPNENFVTLEEKPDTAETTIFQLPVIRINPKAEKEMLEKQYYALMKQAETNCFHMDERQLNLSEEGQYLALLKHAAKRYREFKD